MPNSLAGSARWAWRLAVAGAAAFVVGPLAAHFGLVAALIGFIVFDLGGLLALIAAVVGLVAVVRHADASRALGLRGLVLGGVVAGIFLSVAGSSGKFPRINDITTDTQNAPEFV